MNTTRRGGADWPAGGELQAPRAQSNTTPSHRTCMRIFMRCSLCATHTPTKAAETLHVRGCTPKPDARDFTPARPASTREDSVCRAGARDCLPMPRSGTHEPLRPLDRREAVIGNGLPEAIGGAACSAPASGRDALPDAPPGAAPALGVASCRRPRSASCGTRRLGLRVDFSRCGSSWKSINASGNCR